LLYPAIELKLKKKIDLSLEKKEDFLTF
jgi:hypothetical protein